MNSEQHEAEEEEKNWRKKLDQVYLLFIVQLSFSVCVEPLIVVANGHYEWSRR